MGCPPPPKKKSKRKRRDHWCRKRQVEQRLATDAVEMRNAFPAEENLSICTICICKIKAGFHRKVEKRRWPEALASKGILSLDAINWFSQLKTLLSVVAILILRGLGFSKQKK